MTAQQERNASIIQQALHTAKPAYRIAREHCVSVHTVYRILKKEGVVRLTRSAYLASRYLEGASIEELCKEVGTGEKTIRVYLRDAGAIAKKNIQHKASRRRWNRTSILKKAVEWHVRTGTWPLSNDWNTGKMTDEQRELYELLQPPTHVTVLKYFPSWKEMIRLAKGSSLRE